MEIKQLLMAIDGLRQNLMSVFAIDASTLNKSLTIDMT